MLCRAQTAQKRDFQSLQHRIFAHAKHGSHPTAAIDATGIETRYISQYYKRRAQVNVRHFIKLTTVCHTQSHFLAAAVVSEGPGNDSPQFPEAIMQAMALLSVDRLLADAAYDGEHNHRLCREVCGIRSTVIPLNRRKWGTACPHGRYRQQMHRRFLHRVYGQRWQVESAFSRHKRRLGSSLSARSWSTQERECFLRVLTHNLMLLAGP